MRSVRALAASLNDDLFWFAHVLGHGLINFAVTDFLFRQEQERHLDPRRSITILANVVWMSADGVT